MTAGTVIKEIKKYENKEKAVHLMRFFKTGKGQYGEGDIFIGLTAPQIKDIAKKFYKDISLSETEKVLRHPIHEIRTAALRILTEKYNRADLKEQEKIVKLYLKNTKYINNWDLVDISVEYILGPYCFHNNRNDILEKLAQSGFLWEERMSVVALLYNVMKQRETNEIMKRAEFFLNHEHDLMHKACGWVLREAGKKDKAALLKFLDKHAAVMPRTMLRYSLEKLPPAQKAHYMGMGAKKRTKKTN